MHFGNEENVRTTMQHPAHTAGSDGILVGERPHPRGWGTFARYLAVYVRELGVLSLPECVRHMTSLPAQRLGLADRGLVRPGMAADITVFDPAAVRDVATYDDPRRLAEGFEYVAVNGELVARRRRPHGRDARPRPAPHRKRRVSAVVDAHLHVFAAQSDAYPRPVDDLFPPGGRRSSTTSSTRWRPTGSHTRCSSRSPSTTITCATRWRAIRGASPRSASRIPRRCPRRRSTAPVRRPPVCRGSGSSPWAIATVGDVEQLPAFPLLALLAERGHKLWSYCAPGEIELLGRIAERLPGLTIVLNHLGFSPSPSWVVDEHGRPRIETPLPPPTLPAILELARFAGVHVHFSGQYAFTAEPYPTTTCARSRVRSRVRSAPSACCGPPTGRGSRASPATRGCSRSSTTTSRS